MTPGIDLEEWEPVIGLEVHVQLATTSKIFSGSAVQFGADAIRAEEIIDGVRERFALTQRGDGIARRRPRGRVGIP